MNFLTEYNIAVPEFSHTESGAIKNKINTTFQFYLTVFNYLPEEINKQLNVNYDYNSSLAYHKVFSMQDSSLFLNESMVNAFNMCDPEEFKSIVRIAYKINAILKPFFERRKFLLLSCNILFGKFEEKLVVIGDFSPFSLKISENLENTGLEFNNNKELIKYLKNIERIIKS
ncbi:MAG: hypothetical protein IAE91_09765 [Ignavibacteriaceae bacterium]|nr:hypothetical protein [Ignavibacteriaceae bacterium]